jgi:hypothetical protein
MANFLQYIASDLLVELAGAQSQKVGSQLPQCFNFSSGDIGAFVLLEPKDKEPPACPVRCQQGACASALAASWHGDTLLQDTTTHIRVDETIGHSVTAKQSAASDSSVLRIHREN